MFGAVLLLMAAIGLEVSATAVLPRAQGFTNPFWTVVVVLGYGLSIWLLTLVVKTMPVSIAYAVWAGVGTAVVAVIGIVFLKEPMNLLKIMSVAMIVVGVVGLNAAGSH